MRHSPCIRLEMGVTCVKKLFMGGMSVTEKLASADR